MAAVLSSVVIAQSDNLIVPGERVGAMAAALVLALNVAIAVDSCSDWTKQPDASYWRACVDEKEWQYCQTSVNKKIAA